MLETLLTLLMVALNGVPNAQVEPGAPVLLTISQAEPEVTVTGPDGEPVDLPWDVHERVWTLSPEITRDLPQGLYRIQVRAAGGEQAATMNLVPDDAPDSDARSAERILLAAHYAEATGDLGTALSKVAELIDAQPDLMQPRLYKADLLVANGDTTSALAVLDDALRLFHEQEPDADHPPVLIEMRRTELLRDLLDGEL